MPLEGISDYVDITAVVNPWQALVVVTLIFAVLIWPQMSAMKSVKRVEKTLTMNNGGSSVKDSLDRIEQTLSTHGVAIGEHEEMLASLTAPRRAVEDAE